MMIMITPMMTPITDSAIEMRPSFLACSAFNTAFLFARTVTQTREYKLFIGLSRIFYGLTVKDLPVGYR